MFSTIISNAMYVSVNNSSQVFKIASALYLGLALVLIKSSLCGQHNTVVATCRPLVTG